MPKELTISIMKIQAQSKSDHILLSSILLANLRELHIPTDHQKSS